MEDLLAGRSGVALRLNEGDRSSFDSAPERLHPLAAYLINEL